MEWGGGGAVWRRVVWWGVGVRWCGVVWSGVLWSGVVWCGVVCSVEWCGVGWGRAWSLSRLPNLNSTLVNLPFNTSSLAMVTTAKSPPSLIVQPIAPVSWTLNFSLPSGLSSSMI